VLEMSITYRTRGETLSQKGDTTINEGQNFENYAGFLRLTDTNPSDYCILRKDATCKAHLTVALSFISQIPSDTWSNST